MYQINEFSERSALDEQLAEQVAQLLEQAIARKGQASIAVSGGSTPKGFFKALSQKNLAWKKVTVTLADERWVDIDSDASNTRLVCENLLQNNASEAKFFHLKQGEELTSEVLADLNLAASTAILPLDVLILGMGEDGHTASLFPCSDEIQQGLDTGNADALIKVIPKTAPYDRISFSFASLEKSQTIFLHICGDNKKQVLEQALANTDTHVMPIRAFLHHPKVNTQVYWAK